MAVLKFFSAACFGVLGFRVLGFRVLRFEGLGSLRALRGL
jgi:hypothetical protein